MDAILVMTTFPDRDSALKLAQHLIGEQLAACVNVLGECSSVYRWQAQIETAHETPVLIKTTSARYPEVEAAVRANHPYELPEIVAVRISAGSRPYLAWIAAQTARLAPD
ncbi:MAG: divalent-cation tolerance protein CutA [Burkholderiales bacterium]